MFTALTQLVAEELCVAIGRVTLVQCDTARTPDQGTTSGSQSHPANFNQSNLALAAATAREALFKLASARLAMPAENLTVQDGVISGKADPSNKVSYGELIGGKRFDVPLNRAARRKPAAEWKVLGTPVARLDLPAMVTAQFEFVHNVRVPNMLHGRVVRPPSVGATLAGVDEGSLAQVPGVVKVVVKNNFVGVVAEKPWQAVQAARALKATWTPGPSLPPHREFFDFLRNQKPTRDTFVVDSKGVDAALAGASKVMKATYQHPYQMHGSMGTSCAVADVQGNRATIWSPTQAVYP
jgi:CO/xanthine dehydrogenase Mo-binding subunit